jgi:hypothetical protein
MYIKETENIEIFNLYQLYQDVKTFNKYFDEMKRNFLLNANLKKTNSYVVFQGDKPTYDNNKKLIKVFLNTIDTKIYDKLLIDTSFITNLYYVNFMTNKIKLKHNPTNKINNIINTCCFSIFNNTILKNVEKELKKLIKCKLENIEITE